MVSPGADPQSIAKSFSVVVHTVKAPVALKLPPGIVNVLKVSAIVAPAGKTLVPSREATK